MRSWVGGFSIIGKRERSKGRRAVKSNERIERSYQALVGREELGK